MKKTIVFLVFITISFNISSQDTKRSTAYNYFKEGDLVKAKELIDEVCVNAETSNEAKTWYFKGLIYKELAKKDQNSMQSDLMADESVKAISKSLSLDKDKIYYQDAMNVLLNIAVLVYNNGVLRYNHGIQYKDDESYKNALMDFDNYFEIFKLLGDNKTILEDAMLKNGVDELVIFYYAGYSADMIKNTEKAKYYYSKIYLSKKGMPQGYSNYCEILLNEGNKDEALKVVEQAKILWPADNDIELMKLKVYQQTGKNNVLTDDIEKALISDPNNVNLLSALAEAYDKISFEYKNQKDQANYKIFREKAETNYIKAIDQYPTDQNIAYNLNYNLGVLYFNPAVDAYNVYIERQSEELEIFYKDFFNKAIVRFEKARKIKPENIELLDMMMRVYLILENEDKALELKEKITELKKQ
ncbi:MAG: hypothetical protein A2W91_15535 [Bacteroidetes bacterium GWF2_38_335]|nr:MAG: hypothetical protein A2W91_15535 [Bacteroidetes bacterium GWF2_38_335]OFY81507.1 MAG: hypothetical protein A2281_11395 [Bacteroidetes bacterium RIFOXYA12_FULL_38_20]HBS87674.1 hypothetical protein [Bacteroidales bacterium]